MARRITALDVARGTAMVLVCLSHFTTIYALTTGVTFELVVYLTMTAAPTFMLISGIMLGFFFATKKQEFPRIKRNFITRGIFFLTISRVIITIAHIPISHGLYESLKFVYITDSIGLNIILGPILIGLLRPRARIALGVAGMVVSWLIIVLWNPESTLFDVVKEAFFGDLAIDHSHFLNYAFPFLPWFSLYFVSTCFGEALGAYKIARTGPADIARYLARAGLAAVTVTIVVNVVFRLWALSQPVSESVTNWLVNPFQKAPPSIMYFVLYGGLGLLMVAACFRWQAASWLRSYSEFAAVLGRNSLFVFMLQYYWYYVILYMANLHYSFFWPLYFLASMLSLFVVAKLWEVRDLNRLFTFKMLVAPREARHPSS